jgi:hypothetical protein
LTHGANMKNALQCKYYNRGWQTSLIYKQLNDKNRPNHNICIHTLSTALFFLQAAKETIFSYRTICALLHWHHEPNSHSSQSKCAVRQRIKTRNWLNSQQSPLPNSHTQTKPIRSVLPSFHLQKRSFTDLTSPIPSAALRRTTQNMSTNTSKQNTLLGWKAMQEQVVQCVMTVNKQSNVTHMKPPTATRDL